MPRIFLPEFSLQAQHYDVSKSYDWNYRNAPSLPDTYVLWPAERDWTLCGVPVNSPVSIAAGPLLNGRWLLHYASLGYDVLTYKTVRSRTHPCYDLPNLCPVDPLATGETRRATNTMQGAWAVSFGMPSAHPDFWRFDIEETRRLLPAPKKLAVSVVASPEPEWTAEQVADDYAQCAAWAVESGADFVELNLSCPNVTNVCGQLYQHPQESRRVVERVRERIGTTPLLIKIGNVSDSEDIDLLVKSVESADAVVMINCISASVERDGQMLFDGGQRGIAGHVIQPDVLQQVTSFVDSISRLDIELEVVAVGGLNTVEDVETCLSLGAVGVQVATSAMVGPCHVPDAK